MSFLSPEPLGSLGSVSVSLGSLSMDTCKAGHSVTLGNKILKPDRICSIIFLDLRQYSVDLPGTHSKGNLKKTFNNLTKEQV